MLIDVVKLGNPGPRVADEVEEVLDRINPTVVAVATHIIPDVAILDQKFKLLDLNIVRMHFINEGRLSAMQIGKILNDSQKILQKEKNLLRIDKKTYVIGDIHGQFYDLIETLKNFDLKKDTLLFLGDYVDRGVFSTEVYLYLMLLKSHYPDNIFLLRGNHESQKMTSYFTFKAECLHKYDQKVYERMVESFMFLPLAAVIQGKAFCCHGGISPNLNKVDDINKLNRFQEVQYEGLFCDILWSDPHNEYETYENSAWVSNDKRRCSYFYSYENVKRFLDRNKLDTIIRAHEVHNNGYFIYKSYNNIPTVVTIFSAPNYCDAYKNLGGLVEFDEKIVSIKTFEGVSHPFYLPGYIDGINWSIPFVGEKLAEFAIDLYKEIEKLEQVKETEPLVDALALMRLERECIDEFRDEDSTIDCCILNSKESESEEFEEVLEKDSCNETKKEEEEETGLSFTVAPSQKNELVEEASESGISEINVLVKKDDCKERLIIENTPDKKKWYNFMCL